LSAKTVSARTLVRRFPAVIRELITDSKPAVIMRHKKPLAVLIPYEWVGDTNARE